MSIVTDLIEKKITFSTAVSQFGSWLGKTLGSDQALNTAGADALSVLKQGASDAIALGDTALASHASELATGVAALINATLVKATGGVSAAASPMISAGIRQLVGIAVNAAHAEALAFEASLAPGTTATQPPHA